MTSPRKKTRRSINEIARLRVKGGDAEVSEEEAVDDLADGIDEEDDDDEGNGMDEEEERMVLSIL
jgi:hypothetical protein